MRRSNCLRPIHRSLLITLVGWAGIVSGAASITARAQTPDTAINAQIFYQRTDGDPLESPGRIQFRINLEVKVHGSNRPQPLRKAISSRRDPNVPAGVDPKMIRLDDFSTNLWAGEVTGQILGCDQTAIRRVCLFGKYGPLQDGQAVDVKYQDPATVAVNHATDHPVRTATNSTLRHQPVRVLLTAFPIPPRTEPLECPSASSSNRAVLPAKNQQRTDVDVVDAQTRNLIRDSSVSVLSPCAREDSDSLVRQKHGQAVIARRNQSLFLMEVSAPGYESRTIFVIQQGNGIHFFTEDSVELPVRLPVEIALARISPSQSGRSPQPIKSGISLTSERRLSANEETLTALPLRVPRNPDTVLELAPGYAPAPEVFGHRGPSLSPGIGVAGAFSLNGARSRENNFTVDGSDYNDEEFGVRREGFVAAFPQPLETIGEYQAIIANADARHGRMLGGEINVLSEGGGPRLHLSLYAFASPAGLRARDFFELKDSVYPEASQKLVPITNDGTLSGSQVAFDLAPSYRGPIQVINGFGYQANPLLDPSAQSRASYGFTVGGPLGGAGTYALLAFERENQSGHLEQSFSVPTVRERGFADNGDTGEGSGLSSTFPATTSGNGIFSLVPFPNNPLGAYGPNTYTQALPAQAAGTIASVRLDQNLHFWNRSHTLTVRFNDSREGTDLPSVADAIDSTVRTDLGTSNLASYFSTQIAGSALNVFRFSYGTSSVHFRPIAGPDQLGSDTITTGIEAPYLLNAPLLYNATQPGGPATYSSTYFGPASNAESVTGPVGQINLLGYSPVGIDVYHFPQTRNDHTLQLADLLALTRGRHILYFGADSRIISLHSFADRNARPLAQFGGALGYPSSGELIESTADMTALGIPFAVDQTLSLVPESFLSIQQNQVGIFAQDYFRLAAGLTASAGIRLQIDSLPNADDRLRSAFNPTAFASEVSTAEADCQANLPFPYYVKCQLFAAALKQNFGGSFQEVFGSGVRAVLPRIGLAWNFGHNHDTVVRLGAGEYESAFPAIVIDETRSGFDQYLPVNAAEGSGPGHLSNPASGTLYAFGPNTPPLTLVPGTLNQLPSSTSPIYALASHLLSLATVVPTHLREPYSVQVNTALEQRLRGATTVNLAYVGSFGRHLLRVETPSGGSGERISVLAPPHGPVVPFLFATGFTPEVAPEKYQNSASSSFHSLQFTLEHAGWKGLQGGLAFTFSHAIDDTSDFFDTLGEDALPANSKTPRERGNSAYDLPLRTSGHFIWNLPRSSRHALMDGWHSSGILVRQSGQPYTVGSTIDINDDGNFTDRPIGTTGLSSHSGTGDRRVRLLITQPLAQWAYPQDGNRQQEEIGRNTFRAIGVFSADLAVYRDFVLHDRTRFTIRCDSFNVLNHAQFGIPVRLLEAPQFGVSTHTMLPSRTMQLGVKANF